MPGLPTPAAFILVRTIRRLVALNCTKIADQGLTTIPNSANIAIDGNKPGKSTARSKEKKDKTGTRINFGIRYISLVFNSFSYSKSIITSSTI